MFQKLGVSVLILTFESIVWAATYTKETVPKWPMLLDSQRKLYNYYGMNRACFWDIWGPHSWIAYMRELIKGRLPINTSGDIYQRGGDVLTDENGIVQLHHVGDGPADRPSIDSILSKIKELKKSSISIVQN